MMEPAEDWPCGELAESLDRAMRRRILVQGQMRSEFIVVAGVVSEDSTQMGVAEADLAKHVPLMERLQDLPIPTIAAVRGMCLTAGLEIVLRCDVLWACPY